MLSTELEVLCTWLKCFLLYWNAFYRVGMLSTGLERFLQGWNAFDKVGIPLYTVGMLSTGLECFRQCCYTFVQSWNAF
jgi:hypothetical protein